MSLSPMHSVLARVIIDIKIPQGLKLSLLNFLFCFQFQFSFNTLNDIEFLKYIM